MGSLLLAPQACPGISVELDFISGGWKLTVKSYYQGETVRQKSEVTDEDGTLIDPPSIVITIEAPNGTDKITAEAMVKDDTGKYHYDYIIPDDADVGLWKTEVKATSLTVSIEHDKFEVVERL